MCRYACYVEINITYLLTYLLTYLRNSATAKSNVTTNRLPKNSAFDHNAHAPQSLLVFCLKSSVIPSQQAILTLITTVQRYITMTSRLHIYTYKFTTTFTNTFFLITQYINLAVSQSNRSPTQYRALGDSWVYPTRPSDNGGTVSFSSDFFYTFLGFESC